MGVTRSDLPRVALSMWGDVLDEVLPGPLRTRLRRQSEVIGGDVWSREAALASPDFATIEVLITSWGALYVDDEILSAAPRLTTVIHAAGSVRAVVAPEAWARGIQVSSATRIGAAPVADYTVAMIVLSGHRALAMAGEYAGTGRFPPVRRRRGNDGLTIGIVGASTIGRLVLSGLRGRGFRVLVHDPVVDDDTIIGLGATPATLDELCLRADIVSIHAPALPETHHLFDARRLALLRDGVAVINTARGSLIDTEALVAECRSGRIDAILDVTNPEPLPPGHELFRLPNVTITPHAAGVQGAEISAMGAFAIDELGRWRRGQPLLGSISGDTLSVRA